MNERLRRLSDLNDYGVADDDPDIRGWDVVGADGHDLGEVNDLIIDTDTMKVRYVEVELEGSALRLDDNRHVLVPVNRVDLDTEDEQVVLASIGRQQVTALPAYDPSRPFDSSYDQRYFGTSMSRDEMDVGRRTAGFTPERERMAGSRDERIGRPSDEARITRSEEELAVGKRPRKTGEVSIRKRIETEQVREPVTRERERVNVDRRPVTDETRGRDVQLREGEVRVPIVEEEVVVEKRPVVKEEFVVSKERETDTDTIEADLRRERVDVDREGRSSDTDINNPRGRDRR